MIMAQVRPPGISSLERWLPNEKPANVNLCKIVQMQDRSKPVKYDVQQETYNGSKKLLMPPEQAVHHVPPLSLLASQAITKQRALENDFAFLQDIHTESKFPEHNGYNTRLCRQADMLRQPHTKVAFLPQLVDRPPLTLIPSKPQSRRACHLPELQVRTF